MTLELSVDVIVDVSELDVIGESVDVRLSKSGGSSVTVAFNTLGSMFNPLI